jgi:hypothetical protein
MPIFAITLFEKTVAGFPSLVFRTRETLRSKGVGDN